MSNVAVLAAGLSLIAADVNRIKIDPRKLLFHRTREEPTDPDELKARNERRLGLADSWLEKPINDIIVRAGDYTIADGNERVSGLLLRGVEEITVLLLPAETTDDHLDEISLLTDFHKTALTPFERATLARRHKESTGLRNSELAAKLKIDAGYLTKLLSLFDCHEDVRSAAARGLLGPGDWYAISKSPDQLVTLGLKQGGATRDELAKSTRKKPSIPSIRTSSIRCPLPAGPVIVVKGEDISLEDAIEAIAEAGKLMKAAASKGLNAKTAQNVWKDVAAAG
jgi:hypothetical protein